MSVTKQLAVYGGSFNPPGAHHRAIAVELAKHFDEVVVVPCGPRPDKPTTNDLDPLARATMADLTFRGLDRVEVELFDLEQARFTRTHRLDAIFRDRGVVWHVVGTDLTRKGDDGRSFIQSIWAHGEEVWTNLKFAVVVRRGFHVDRRDLPPQHRLVEVGDTGPAGLPGSSRLIRERVFHHQPVDGLVAPEVAAYIERYGLYRGGSPSRCAALALDEPRIEVVWDEANPRAREIAATFEKYRVREGYPNLIAVIGGDGTMLHSIRRWWRRRVPFLGVRAGHRGFLLNRASELAEGRFAEKTLHVQQSPLLYVEVESPEGAKKEALAFNDAWVERATGQTAWIEVVVDGVRRLPRLVADGALVATAAGSTGYARAMGATPLLVDAPALLLVGSNVAEPPHWKSALLALRSQIELRALDAEKRPLMGFVDGVPQGRVTGMRVRVSRIAAVELAFCPGHDMAQKITQIQFPNHMDVR